MITVKQCEVHFQIQTTVTASWFKKGNAPKVKSFPGRSKVSYSGFVMPDNGRQYAMRTGKSTYKATIESTHDFISANPPKEDRKYAIFLDNAPWHKNAHRLIERGLKMKSADIHKKVRLICLPPYSPDLHPLEQVWRITRRKNTE